MDFRESDRAREYRERLEAFMDECVYPAEATIGDSLRWSAVKDTQRAKPVIVGRDFVVATVAPPTVIEEEAAPAAAPAAPEATKQKKPAAAAPAAAAKPAAKKK